MGAGQPWEALDVDDSDLPSLLRPCKHRQTTLTIPGPAGAVKSAMLRKTLDRNSDSDEVISTQEYVRKAVEDNVEFDDDFTGIPWVSALQFLGVGEGGIPSTPISSIKKCTDVGEADQVAIFSPVRSSQYLNVTLRNLVKLFGQGTGPSTQNYVDNPAQTEYPGKANALKLSPMQSTETEDTTCRMRLNKGKERLLQKENLFTSTSKLDERTNSNHIAGVKRGYSELSQDPGLEASQGKHSATFTAGQREPALDNDRAAEGEAVSSIDPVANSDTNKGNGDESQRTNDVQMERQSLMSKASLPQWTDEQLDELFADDDDGGSLF